MTQDKAAETVLGLERGIIDQNVYDRNVARLRGAGITLPRIADLRDPVANLSDRVGSFADTDPDGRANDNLFRVHWHNSEDRRGLVDVPAHVVLGPEITGVDAKIIVALGNRFPMIEAHKVLAAYGCLVPRLLSGKFDAENHRAVWPSTGNYCRGGVAISRILGCRSVAILPEGMSRERFDWLEAWTNDPSEIHRTPGGESNVKEIYDACHMLAKDPQNVIFNQFSEYGNYIIHRAVTGTALERVFAAQEGGLTARAFVAASGSGGTLAAGDHLKEKLGTDICVVEATECPTLLYNGYGDHNIQGIGDKHVPLIHNTLNTDYVIGVSDQATDHLNLLFNTDAGRSYLAARTGADDATLESLGNFGLSSIANIVAAIKFARYNNLGASDAVLTVAVDGAAMYRTEADHAAAQITGGSFGELDAAEAYGRHIKGATIDHVLELDRAGRQRIFNLGYYTWVEQQGISQKDFDVRRDQGFWNGLMDMVAVWDDMIDRFNAA